MMIDVIVMMNDAIVMMKKGGEEVSVFEKHKADLDLCRLTGDERSARLMLAVCILSDVQEALDVPGDVENLSEEINEAKELLISLFEAKNRVVIEVEGGLVQTVYLAENAEVIVVDRDICSVDEEVVSWPDTKVGAENLENVLKNVVRTQWLPAPDEAQVTTCPWCGEVYDVSDTTPEQDYVDEACPQRGLYPKTCEDCAYFTGTCEIPKKHKCGYLVRFRGWESE